MTTRELAAALLDLVLPTSCGGCGLGGIGWCPECAARVDGPVTASVPGVGTVWAAGRYRGPLRTALLGYKERGRRDLAGPLAGVLAPLVPAGALLVPVPSRAAAARARGGDHVLRLCRELAPAEVWPLLAITRRARDSVGLDAAARAANLAGRIRVRSPVNPPRGVLLVDDVVTTGATLRACRAALVEVGIRVDGALVLCTALRRPRRLPGSLPTPPKYGLSQVRGREIREYDRIGVTRRSGLLPDRDAHYRAWHT
ncbi:hypothetical protein GCM10009836_66750 [Pseudonocardia ailaonensis]|uniref:Phosphoribosyltransferase n=1 Tax=Pseudonocardia ailaonensis TaxID=367279 RepID=A0ABN2NNB2_9PSEU